MAGDYQVNGGFSARMPSPPRIKTEPDDMNSVVDLSSYANQPGAPSFLSQYDWKQYSGSLETNQPVWNYSNRWQAQAILPYLFVGPLRAGRDPELTRTAGLTMKITLRYAREYASRIEDSLGLGFLDAHIFDVPNNQALISLFPAITRMINEHLESGQRNLPPGKLPHVMLCCETGNERAPAAAVAYIMETFGVSLIDAIQVVRKTRFCSNLDASAVNILQAYSGILQASRDTGYRTTPSSSVLAPVNAASNPRKRRVSDAEIADVTDETGEHVDSMQLDNRGFAPFRDYEA